MARLRLTLLLAGSYLLGASASASLDFPEGGPERPEAQLARAAVQTATGEAGTAQQTILDVIDQIENAEKTDGGLLIDAYVGLGNAYAVDGQYPLAMVAYQNAGDLSRREQGLFNDKLIDILYRMRYVAWIDGDQAGAFEFQQEAERVKLRARQQIVTDVGATHGIDSREYLDARLDYAHWLVTNSRQPARRAYYDILTLIEDEFDDDPELNVMALRAMAANVGNYWVTMSDSYRILGEPFELVHARRIAKRMHDSALQAEVYRDIGDWRLSARRFKSAERAYQAAWELLDEVEDGDDLQRDLFGEPDVVWVNSGPSRPALTRASSAQASPGQVELEIFVDATGRARDIRVVSADPPDLSATALRQVPYAVFRPRMVDGEFVGAEGRFVWSVQ